MKIIGIDLGTTNSAVAVYENGVSHTIALKGAMTTPSVIWVNPEGEYVVGREAKQHVAVDPEHVMISTKRDLGSDKTYMINGESHTPTDAATLILGYLKREASKTLGEEVNDVVITVPAYFGSQERGEVHKAAINAGLNPLCILTEPVAAAYRYGFSMEAHQIVFVVDLGGGTFDTTTVEVSYNKVTHQYNVEPLKWDGDHNLGGDDFDNAIIEWMIQNGAKGFKNKLELKFIAEAAKIELASLNETTISHPIYLPNEIILTRSKFKTLINDKLVQIGETIKRTIDETIVNGRSLEMDDINRFVLVGGSCKHPVVREYVSGIIGKEPFSAPNLDTYVAEGAAIKHHLLKLPHPPKPDDNKLPHSLGTDLTIGGERINAVLLEQGTVLPCRGIQIAYLSAESSMLRSYVLEGNKRAFEDNKELQVIDVPVENTGYPHVIFTEFNLDTSGLLSFNTFVLDFTDENISIIEDAYDALSNSAEGDAHKIKADDWDEFYAKYSKYMKHKPIQLKLN